MLSSSVLVVRRLVYSVGPTRLIIFFVFLAAAFVRVAYLNDSRIMAERQFRSALIARATYLAGVDDAPQWRREIAEVSAARMGTLEPPIMEYLATAAYRVLGGEQLWAPRLFATVFWLIGGLCLFLLARTLTSEEAALYATAYFLFLPLGVSISTSFLPDSLMIMLLTAGLLGLVRYERAPSTLRFAIVGCLGAASVLIKPLGLFAFAAAFIALRWSRRGFRGLFDTSAIMLGMFVAAPTVLWYGYGIYGAGFLEGQAQASFIPALLLQPAFWTDTLRTALSAVGPIPLTLALLGFSLPTNRDFRPVIVGLCVGYALLCFAFTYHVRISGHYHLQLSIPIAICLGAAVEALVDRVRRGAATLSSRSFSVLGAAALVAALGAWAISRTLNSQSPIVDRAVARAVGEAVQHSGNVVYVSQFYGVPLEYYGELSGWYWPRAETSRDRALLGARAPRRTVEERLRSLSTDLTKASENFEAEYFVITDFREFSQHDDLAEFLDQRCRLLEASTDYRVFGDCIRP